MARAGLDELLNSSPPVTPVQSPSALPQTPHSSLQVQTPAAAPEFDFSFSQTPVVASTSADTIIQTPVSSRKRPSREDFTQYANNLSRNVRLKTVHHEMLLKFAELPECSQPLVWLAAQQLSMKERVDLIQPPNTKVELPQTLDSKIDTQSLKYFFDPTLSAYMAWPNKKLTAWLKAHPEYLPPTIREHKPSMQDISTKISNKFTQYRNVSKNVIAKSLRNFDKDGNDGDGAFIGPFIGIVEVTRKLLLEVGGKMCDITPSLPLVARVAFWRQVYVEEGIKSQIGKPGSDFWKAVDDGLKKIREKKNDEKKISAVFAKILEADQQLYVDALNTPESLDDLLTVAAPVDES